MASDDFLKELSPYQIELGSRVFNLLVSKVLKRVYLGFDEKTKENMTAIFNSDNDQEKEKFIKENIHNFDELFEEEMKKIEDNIKEEIERIKVAMAKKNLEHEEYRVLVGSLDIAVRNYQLLSGGATSLNVLVLPSEVMERNAIKENDGSTKPNTTS